MIPEQVSNQPKSQKQEPGLDLRRYQALFNQWWWLVALVTASLFIVALIVSVLMPATYQSSTTLLVNQSSGSARTSVEMLQTSEILARTYAQMIVKRPVLEKTIQRVGVNMTAAELGEMLTVTTVRNTQLIVVQVTGPNAPLNADLANSLVLTFAEDLRAQQTARFAESIASYQAQISDVENQIAQTTQTIEAATDPAEI